MVAVQPATPQHADAIRSIDGLSASTARVLGYDLTAHDRCCLVAIDEDYADLRTDSANQPANRASQLASQPGGGRKQDEAVVGYVAAIVQFDEAHVIDVAVMSACRRRGVATALLDALDTNVAARGANHSTLEVAAGNLAALQLYRQRGYVVEGRRPGYYPDGQDALIMWRRDEGN